MPEYTLEKATVDFSIIFTLSHRAESGCQGDKEDGEEGAGDGGSSVCGDESWAII